MGKPFNDFSNGFPFKQKLYSTDNNGVPQQELSRYDTVLCNVHCTVSYPLHKLSFNHEAKHPTWGTSRLLNQSNGTAIG
jgi:hypothetical protein